jgi:hypothetical protein
VQRSVIKRFGAMRLAIKISHILEGKLMHNNDWMISIFVGIVLSLAVVALVAARMAGG